MNKLIEVAALTALKIPNGVKLPGQCWRFVRLMLETLQLPSPGPGLDAKQAALFYAQSGFAIKHFRYLGSKPGDVLFWLDGLHGHVAVRISGNRIAENSSVHSTDGSDARGTRNLRDVRPPDIVIRFPAKANGEN